MQRFLGAGCPAAFRIKDVQAPSGNLAGSGRVVATRKELCQASDFLSLGPPVVGHGGPLSEMPVYLPRGPVSEMPEALLFQSHLPRGDRYGS